MLPRSLIGRKKKKKRASVELCQNNARESYSKPRTMNRAVLGGRARKFKVTRLEVLARSTRERERERRRRRKRKNSFDTRNKFIANPVERNAACFPRIFASRWKKIAEKNFKKSDRMDYWIIKSRENKFASSRLQCGSTHLSRLSRICDLTIIIAIPD